MRKRTIGTCLLAVLAFCLAAGSLFTSCRKEAESAETANGPVLVGQGWDSAQTDVLTGVYRPVDLPLPEGYRAGYETQQCTPFVDPETGAITVLLTRIGEREDLPPYILATTDAEHGVTETVPLPDLGGKSISRWAFDAEGRCFFTAGKTREQSGDGFYVHRDIYLYRFDPPSEENTGGTLSEGLYLNPFFGEGNGLDVNNFITDAEGNIWVECSNGGFSGRRIVFTPELVQKTVKDDRNNSPMTAVPESAGGGAAVKLNSTIIGAKLIAPDGTERKIELPEMPDRVIFPSDGDGRTFYYSSNTGVWKAALDGRDNASVECLMDFGNSNVKTNVNGGGSDWSYLLAVLSEDCILFTEGNGLTLYTASGNIDLSTLKVIEIALGAEGGWEAFQWPDLIVEYNKTHPDCRLVVTDYTLYNNAENPDGGIRKLTIDIVTGIYRPDLVIGDYGGDLMQVLVRDHIYADLSPFIDADDAVNRDNLFDCVERMFSAGEETWGLAAGVELWGPFTSQSILDKYAPDLTEESGWSFERMLDFAESTPDDVVFYHSLRQDNADRILLGPDGYSVFIDMENGEAKFDSPLFLRWLKFCASLPKDLDDWLKSTPTGRLRAARDDAGIYDYAYRDRIALQWIGVYDMSLDRAESLFGTKDWVFLGHPGEGHSGIDCQARNALVMTKWCAEKELCWDVIRMFMTTPVSFNGLPALESLFDYDLERRNPMDHQAIVYFDGATVGSERDPDLTPDKLTRPGYIVLPEERDFEHIKRVLNAAGYPMTEKVSSDITEIVAEEMSAFLGGVGTAEDCAAKIQSRVSIWLAENK